MSTRHAILDTQELGALTLVASDHALVGVYYPQHWTNPDPSTFGDEVDIATDPVLAEAASQLSQYLQGQRTTFELATAAHGSAFEERVWALLRAIPFGQTTTYGALADQLGGRTLARIVGQAVGNNPLSIVVGCHRVVGTNGKLTGYAGGLPRKHFLLALEAPALATAGALF